MVVRLVQVDLDKIFDEIPRIQLASADPFPRLWLIFFGEARGRPWWAFIFKRGYRHVCAAAWFDQAQRWLYFDPLRRGLHIEIETDEGFAGRFGYLYEHSTVILRCQSQFDRGNAFLPASFWCVGAIKSLLGLRSCALSPRQLFNDLLARGAQIVEKPAESAIGSPIQQPESPTGPAGPAGRSGHQGGAGCRTGEGGSGAPQGDAAAAHA